MTWRVRCGRCFQETPCSQEGQKQIFRLHSGRDTFGIWSVSSWYHSWPRIQPSPHRKSFKARQSSQPGPWLQCACTSWGRTHAGSPNAGINPRTNEQVWQDWKWEQSRRIRGIESFLSLSISCRCSVASNHRIHLQTMQRELLIWIGVIACRLM